MDKTLLEEELDVDDIEYAFENELEDMETSLCKSNITNFNAWTSFALGIVGSLGWMIPLIGFPVTIVGTVLGAVSMKHKKNKGIGIAGFIISMVFLVASITKGIIDIVLYCKKSK